MFVLFVTFVPFVPHDSFAFIRSIRLIRVQKTECRIAVQAFVYSFCVGFCTFQCRFQCRVLPVSVQGFAGFSVGFCRFQCRFLAGFSVGFVSVSVQGLCRVQNTNPTSCNIQIIKQMYGIVQGSVYVLYGFLHTFFICIYTQFGEQLSLQSPARHALYAKKGRLV